MNSRVVSLIAVFAALNIVCDSFTSISLFDYGVWWSWIFLIAPITGFVLGPYSGFLSTFTGVMIGHFIYFRGTPEFLFTIGAPIGAMVSGLLIKGKEKIVLVFYTVLFVAYFSTPIAWQLPVWGIWDTCLAYICILSLLLLIKVIRRLDGIHTYSLALYTFIGLEADILFRIFLLVPCQTYRLIYGWPLETLQGIWTLAAAVTPIQVALSILISLIVGSPLLKILKERELIPHPLFP